MNGWMNGWTDVAAAVGLDVFLQTHADSGMVQDDDHVGLCSASTYRSITSTIINIINISTVGGFSGEQGALRYLLRAPLAFVEDIPEDKHYFGPEQPQSGLESSLHLPFPVRLDTTSKRYLLFLFTEHSRRARSPGGWRKEQ